MTENKIKFVINTIKIYLNFTVTKLQLKWSKSYKKHIVNLLLMLIFEIWKLSYELLLILSNIWMSTIFPTSPKDFLWPNIITLQCNNLILIMYKLNYKLPGNEIINLQCNILGISMDLLHNMSNLPGLIIWVKLLRCSLRRRRLWFGILSVRRRKFSISIMGRMNLNIIAIMIKMVMSQNGSVNNPKNLRITTLG